MLTADKGMAGAYNQNIIKFLKENADENDRFYVIGQTGYRACTTRTRGWWRISTTVPRSLRCSVPRDITMDAHR